MTVFGTIPPLACSIALYCPACPVDLVVAYWQRYEGRAGELTITGRHEDHQHRWEVEEDALAAAIAKAEAKPYRAGAAHGGRGGRVAVRILGE